MRITLNVICVCVVLSGFAAFGQTLGEISGEVRDPSGATVPQVVVTVTNVNTNATREVLTNESGVYSFPALPPGAYDLKVAREGFKTITRKSVQIEVQQSARIDFVLQVGQVSESVDVGDQVVVERPHPVQVAGAVAYEQVVGEPVRITRRHGKTQHSVYLESGVKPLISE